MFFACLASRVYREEVRGAAASRGSDTTAPRLIQDA